MSLLDARVDASLLHDVTTSDLHRRVLHLFDELVRLEDDEVHVDTEIFREREREPYLRRIAVERRLACVRLERYRAEIRSRKVPK